MCGIVAYFGGAPNSLTRVITGMSAIIYRAPDSTGVATFGNLSEAICIRKNIGSVSRLIETLEDNPIKINFENEVYSLWQSENMTSSQMQKNLIAYENLSLDIFNKIEQGDIAYPVIEELLAFQSYNRVHVVPGYPGRPYRLEKFRIRSRNDLKKVVETMLKTYDLSFVAIKSTFRKALVYGIEVLGKADLVKADATDIYNAFDHLFQRIFEEYRPYVKQRESHKRVHLNPLAKKYLWQLISSIPVMIPDDFDRDGISNLFRIIDEAVVSRIVHHPVIGVEIQECLNQSLVQKSLSRSYNWHTLYRAEKGVNVYGRAAAAALEWLNNKELLTDLSLSMSKGIREPVSDSGGIRDAKGLNYLLQPILTQGRWALQSEVTIENAHPFIDETGRRAIALNGQFSTQVEDQMRKFLSDVVKISFRSGNSSEYFALLWGYYFDHLINEKKQFQEVKDYTEKGLDEYAVGSTSINYQTFKQVQAKKAMEIDEIAFIEAAKRFTKSGGQIAVAGMSIESPRTLYAAASNRPLFIVKRKGTDDYMVVSDINASLGLFSQTEIMDVTQKYERILKARDKKIDVLKRGKTEKADIEKLRKEYSEKTEEVLSAFAVEVYALERENVFAKVAAVFKNGFLTRELTITDFSGTIIRDIEPYAVHLTPPHVHKDMEKSFYESHLYEVPDLLENMVGQAVERDFDVTEIDINIKKFQRRFGKGLKGVKRLFISGMGSSYNTAEFTACFIRRVFPNLQVITVQPVEIESVPKTFVPEEDLVLLISWSATTAEMVKFAKELYETDTQFIGITEKIFGDMALIARKSLGVVYAGSGEEVTVQAVKSTFCMFMCINIFSLSLYRNVIGKEIGSQIVGNIVQIPHLVKHVLTDTELRKAAENLARNSSEVDSFFVVDALLTTATGKEAVLKMEELTWWVTGKAVDYTDVQMNLFRQERRRNLVVVNATCSERVGEAVDIMEKLYSNSIEFFAVTFESLETKRIEKISRGNMVILPKSDDYLQPFIDIAFYYMFAFFSGQVRGRSANEYPRNRAKSVTTSRQVNSVSFSVQGEYYNMRDREAFFKENCHERPDFQKKSLFEKKEFTLRAKQYFRSMRRIGALFLQETPFEKIVDFKKDDHRALSDFIFSSGTETEILFIPMDTIAEAAAQKTVSIFQRLLKCRMRVVKRSEFLHRTKEDALSIIVSSQEEGFGPGNTDSVASRHAVWFGCNVPETDTLKSIPHYVIKKSFSECCDDSVLYAGLCLMLIHAVLLKEPEKGGTLLSCFRRSGWVIHSVLNDDTLHDTIQECVKENNAYKSLLFLSPPDGTGLSFSHRFNSRGLVMSEFQPFGAGAHGPLVTVDNRVEAKYVRIEERELMVQKYGEKRVKEWETIYMKKRRIDAVTGNGMNEITRNINTPFFAEGEWYLPVLNPDYNVGRDNLIVLDATNERYIDHAADELAVFGCRHARIIVITQDYFLEVPEKSSFQKFPVSGMLTIPAIKGLEQKVPLSDFHIPFALNITAAAFAESQLYKQ